MHIQVKKWIGRRKQGVICGFLRFNMKPAYVVVEVWYMMYIYVTELQENAGFKRG
jgi:hypothetical protein